MNPNAKTIDDIQKTGELLRREGKVDKDTYDWFTKEYHRHQRDNGVKQQHEDALHPSQAL